MRWCFPASWLNCNYLSEERSVNILQTQWWDMALPDEWHAEQEDDLILISDCDDVGEIAITTLTSESGAVDERALRELTADLEAQHGPGKAITLGDWRGMYFSFHEDGDALREWYLYQNRLLLLITYSCDDDNAGMDDAAVDEILATIYISDGNNNAD